MKRSFLLWAMLLMLASAAWAQPNTFETFMNPPREARPYVWWHWINGNTSKEGIRKDLAWMDRIGIAGFHQFDAGGAMMQSLPPVVEPTPYLSDAWKENFAFAIRLADSLGMEVGIASAPGWSSTGGPWVEPADAMKKLTWRTLEVEGGHGTQTLRLPAPYDNIGKFLNADAGLYASVFAQMTPWYQDVAVVAVRLPDEDKNLRELGATVSSSGGDFTLEQLTDGDIANGAELLLNRAGTHAWLQYSFPEPVTIRAYTLVGGEAQDSFATLRSTNNYLECSDDGVHWREVCRIPSSPVPQLTAAIPPTTARYFRLMIVNPKPDYTLWYYGVPVVEPTGTRIHEWNLHTVDKVNHAEEKAGFASPVDLVSIETPVTLAPVREVIDLTARKAADGTLRWNVPAGRWRIYRFGASLTGKQNHPAPPEATGLEVDKLDPGAWNRYFHRYLDLYKDAAGGLLGKRGIRYLMIDSYEAEHMTWTPRMKQAFRSARGYDLTTWLPALAGEILVSTEATEGFIFDWRETLGELFAANYDRVNDILREYGMAGRYTESHESSRTFVGDGMDPKRSAAVPMAAIWTEDSHTEIINMADIRESASVAHLYGQNIVAGESFTTNGMYGQAYTWYPGDLKKIADLALLSGLNRFFIHESTHQPADELRPGLGLLIFGQWFSRHETWADYAKYWMDYLARSCYLLQQGRYVADVLWYYGEGTNVVSESWKAHPEVPDEYSYDFASPHALLHLLRVRDGRAVSESGMSYRVVALGEHTRTMSVEILRKLQKLVDGGVFLVGAEPLHMAGLGDDPAEFQRLVADIWHSGRSNVWTGSVAEGLQRAGVAPDFQADAAGIRFVHRVDGDKHIYWVRNFSGKEAETRITLRDARGPVTVLDPVSGKPVYGVLHDGMLHLGADQALFLVADPSAEPVAEPAPLRPAGKTFLTGPWTVSFEGMDAPQGGRTWHDLASLTASEEPAVKYFSGTTIYRNNFSLPRYNLPDGIAIDLGEVGQMADVWINGEHADFLWKAPYRTEFTGTLKPGTNTIEVRVVNTWVNRLIGDAQPGAEGHSYTVVPFYQADSPLQPAGLMGPVRLDMLRTFPEVGQVRFDADFEGGSLGSVTLLDSARVVVAPGDTVTHLSYVVTGRFDPDNPVDTGLAPSANWYFFRMTGVKGKQIYLTQPDNGVVRKSYSYDGETWDHLPLAESKVHFLDKRFTRDTVYIALYNPYTYSYLQERLQTWSTRPDVTLDTIGFSHEGRPLQLLHITDASVPAEQKARVWLHGRIHPSESPASYLVDGLVEYLTSDTPEACSLRRQVDAWILPFANPDGVANGLSRSNVLGVNQEINFDRNDDSTVVEVRAIKKKFEELTAERPFDFMLNSHSQHAESSTFWMHRGSTTTPSFFRKLWTYTGLVSSFNPCIQPRDMNFSNMASRYAEGWMWNHAGENTIALTIETPYTCYSFDRDGLWADNDNIYLFGRRTMQGIAEYLGLSLPGRYIVETPARMKGGWVPYRGDERSFLGTEAWEATRAGASVTYQYENLPAGRYAVYRFVAGDCVEPERTDLRDPVTGQWTDPGIHGWVSLDTVDQKKYGRFRYTYHAAAPGDMADALLLIRCE